MIYTLGHTESYLEYYNECLKNDSKFLKLGKKEMYEGKPYPGGYAFKTLNEALQYLEDNKMFDYSVFGLNADWDKDTEHNESKLYNNLLNDSEIIILDKFNN
jgi:hypothetical protein